MTLPERLKIDTRREHAETEALLFSDKIMAGNLSLKELKQLLAIHYRYHHSLEQALEAQANFFSEYDRATRQKTPWLEADHQTVGLQLPPAEELPNLFAGWNNYQLLGALYVGEGSMLGGKVIGKALGRSPELTRIAENLRFFGGYGDQTGPRWKSFGAFLLQRADGQDDTIVEAAKRAFVVFQNLSKPTTSPQTV